MYFDIQIYNNITDIEHLLIQTVITQELHILFSVMH